MSRDEQAHAASRLPAVLAWCSRIAPSALTHVNLLLFLYAGAGLVTAARLKWDPSLYIVVRMFLPLEYKVTAVALCVGSFAHLLLGHLCVVALAGRRAATRRALLITYAVAMVLLVVGELVWCIWTAIRLAEFLRHELGENNGVSLFYKFKNFLGEVSWLKVNMLTEIKLLMEEVEEDVVQTTVYVAGASVLLFGVLELMAVVLALLAAQALGAQRMGAHHRLSNSWETTTMVASVEKLVERNVEKAPLRSTDKNGRIVIL